MPNASSTRKRLTDRLRAAQADGELGRFRVVALHDFSLDRIIGIRAFPPFVQTATRILSQGGGLLPDSSQSVQPGGCAAGAATTVARLGIETHFVCRTDELGGYLLRYYLGRRGVNLEHVRTDGRLALAACIEVGADRHNIMINDQASFADFGYENLTAADLELMDTADVIGVFDWCLNRKGTGLAAGLCERFGTAGRKIYFDTSDPAPRQEEIPELMAKVFRHPGLSFLNLNENELHHFSGDLGGGSSLERLVELTQALQARIHPQLTVHTIHFSLDVSRGVTVVPTFCIAPRRATGSGDTWNGGNIAGHLLGLEPDERLMMANAVDGYYCAMESGDRPTLDRLIEFLEDPGLRLNELEAAPARCPTGGARGPSC